MLNTEQINTVSEVFDRAKDRRIAPIKFNDTASMSSRRYGNDRGAQSLWRCTEDFIDMLKKDSQESFSIMKLLYCLPSGLKREHITKLLALEEGAVIKCIDDLRQFKFLEPITELSDKVRIGGMPWLTLKQTLSKEKIVGHTFARFSVEDRLTLEQVLG